MIYCHTWFMHRELLMKYYGNVRWQAFLQTLCLHGKHPSSYNSNRKKKAKTKTLNSASVERACKFSVLLPIIQLYYPLPDSFTTRVTHSALAQITQWRWGAFQGTGILCSSLKVRSASWGKGVKSAWGTTLSLEWRMRLSSLQRKFHCSAVLSEEESHEKFLDPAALPSPESSVHLPGFFSSIRWPGHKLNWILITYLLKTCSLGYTLLLR